MCLLVGVIAKVQAPRWVVCQSLILGSSFCGCDSSNLEPPTMGIAVALSSIAAAIPMVGGSRLDEPQPQKEEPKTKRWHTTQRGA